MLVEKKQNEEAGNLPSAQRVGNTDGSVNVLGVDTSGET